MNEPSQEPASYPMPIPPKVDEPSEEPMSYPNPLPPQVEEETYHHIPLPPQVIEVATDINGNINKRKAAYGLTPGEAKKVRIAEKIQQAHKGRPTPYTKKERAALKEAKAIFKRPRQPGSILPPPKKPKTDNGELRHLMGYPLEFWGVASHSSNGFSEYMQEYAGDTQSTARRHRFPTQTGNTFIISNPPTMMGPRPTGPPTLG